MHDSQVGVPDASTRDEVGAPAAVQAVRPASYAAYRARSHFGSLDGLRALSILAVMWHHGVEDGWLGARLPGTKLGFLGVDLFFVISGFLIVTLLLRERERTNHISLRHFYIRRALRIFPLYYGLLALFALVYALRRTDKAALFFHDLPYLLTYLTNWFPAAGIFAVTWSLAAEEQFYLVWPPVERFLKGMALPLLIVLIALSQLILFGALDGPLALLGFGPQEPVMLRQTTFTPILLGVLLAHALHHEPSFARVASLLGRPYAAALALALLAIVPHFYPADISATPRLSIHLMMLFLVTSTVIREDHALAGFLKWAPLARIGALSYGLYLLHNIGNGVADAALRRLGLQLPFAMLLVGGGLSYVLAELSFRYYEARFLRLKQRFA